MTSTALSHRPTVLVVSVLIRLYVVIAVATVAGLAVLSVVAPDAAPRDAWVHAVVVVVFAAVLPLRLRSARKGNAGGWRAVGVIAAVLFLANVIEAMVPHFAPGWMRLEMIGIAAVMLGVIGAVVTERVSR